MLDRSTEDDGNGHDQKTANRWDEAGFPSADVCAGSQAARARSLFLASTAAVVR